MNANVDVPAFLTIFTIYLEAFAEHDPVRRRRLLARCLSEDSEIWGPNRMFVGISEITDKIASFQYPTVPSSQSRTEWDLRWTDYPAKPPL